MPLPTTDPPINKVLTGLQYPFFVGFITSRVERQGVLTRADVEEALNAARREVHLEAPEVQP